MSAKFFLSVFSILTLMACAADSDADTSTDPDPDVVPQAFTFSPSCDSAQQGFLADANAGVEWMSNYHMANWSSPEEQELRSFWFGYLGDSKDDVWVPLRYIHATATNKKVQFVCEGVSGDCASAKSIAFVTADDEAAKRHIVHVCNRFFTLDHDGHDFDRPSKVGTLAHEYAHFVSDIHDSKNVPEGRYPDGSYGAQTVHLESKADPLWATNNGDNWRLYIMSVIYDSTTGPYQDPQSAWND
jgi:hypothetical protein